MTKTTEMKQKLVPDIDIAGRFAEKSVGLTPRQPARESDVAVPRAVAQRAAGAGIEVAEDKLSSDNFENRGVKLS